MSRQAALPTKGVAVAYLYAAHTEGLFTDSLAALMLYDGNHRRHLWHGGLLSAMTGPPLDTARNGLIRRFLDDPDLGAWLWFIDTDMTFPPNTLDRLLSVADPVERPVVGGLCFAGSYRVPLTPTLYQPDGSPLADWERGQPVQVAATGAACLLIHRRVFEEMQKRTAKPDAWFEDLYVDGRKTSEDKVFCARLEAMDIPLWVHTGVGTGHVKPVPFTEQMYDATRR